MRQGSAHRKETAEPSAGYDKAVRILSPILLAAFGLGLAAVAFLRGSSLFGITGGALYTAISAALLWLFVRSLVSGGKISYVRTAGVAAFSVAVGWVMAFPAKINPDVRHVIEKQATDRAARAELAAVFASDPAFKELSVSTAHPKV